MLFRNDRTRGTFELFKDGDDYGLRHAEMASISAFGATLEDVFREFGIAFQLAVEVIKEDGVDIKL